MKFEPDPFDTINIAEYDRGWLKFNIPTKEGIKREVVQHSVLIHAKGQILPWEPKSFEALSPKDFILLADWQPQVVLFGSGTSLQFCPPAYFESLYRKGIGVETMDTQAACRTFNILVQEGRQVAAALLL
jgi:uncharacterized protein